MITCLAYYKYENYPTTEINADNNKTITHSINFIVVFRIMRIVIHIWGK